MFKFSVVNTLTMGFLMCVTLYVLAEGGYYLMKLEFRTLRLFFYVSLERLGGKEKSHWSKGGSLVAGVCTVWVVADNSPE